MFPWICLSFKNNYSKIINECFSSATKYMTVEDERKKTKCKYNKENRILS